MSRYAKIRMAKHALVRLIPILILLQPRDFGAARAEDWRVGGTVLTHCDLPRWRSDGDVYDVDLDITQVQRQSHRRKDNTHVLLRMQRLRKVGILRGVHDMRLRHREVVRAAEGLDRAALRSQPVSQTKPKTQNRENAMRTQT